MTETKNDAVSIGLDHIGFIVSDLAVSATLAAQLGFALTERADHTRIDDQGRTVSAGSAQHAIMLRNGYIELMQIVDPEQGHQLASAAQHRFGLHVVAFGTDDALACNARCLANGVQAGPVLHWTRAVHEPDLEGTAQFAYFGSAWTAHDPSYLCWVEHRTPQLLRNERLLTHANGVQALRGIRYAGPRASVQDWADRLVAAGAMRQDLPADGLRMVLPNAQFEIHVDDSLASMLPQAVVFGGVDGTWMRSCCERIGVAHHTASDGTLTLDLTSQLGLHWVFQNDTTASAR